MEFQMIVRDAISLLKNKYGVRLVEADIYVVENLPYIVTKGAAGVFNTSNHNFSTQYVRPLLYSGVRRIKIGKHKYYRLQDILERFQKATSEGISIFEVCKAMTKKKRKK